MTSTTQPTVYAVMKATIEIPIRSSSSNETFAQMHKVAKEEAEGFLRNEIATLGCRIIGPVEFSHAIVKER